MFSRFDSTLMVEVIIETPALHGFCDFGDMVLVDMCICATVYFQLYSYSDLMIVDFDTSAWGFVLAG